MKIALCFYGKTGNSDGKDTMGKPLDLSFTYEYYLKNILSCNENVDIFMHTWSEDSVDELNKLYNPKLISSGKAPIENIGTAEGGPELGLRAFCRWSSTKNVIDLKKSWEKEHGFKYDVVMLARYDWCWFTELKFKNFDMNYFWATNWNDGNINVPVNHINRKGGFYDPWFFSNSDNMDKFGNLIDRFEKYNSNPHISSKQHIDWLDIPVKYHFYVWEDHALTRRKVRHLKTCSNVINLIDYFNNCSEDYCVLRISKDFPNYHPHSDIDILCKDKNKMVKYTLDYLNKTFGEKAKIAVHHPENGLHSHVDVYFSEGKLDLKFDFIESFDMYNKNKVSNIFVSELLKNKVKKNLVYVPKTQYEMVIRNLEYLEYINQRPDKIKHLNYINNNIDYNSEFKKIWKKEINNGKQK